LVVISKTATSEQILDVVREWVDVLSHRGYAEAAHALGYAIAFGESPEVCIRRAIESYRSPELYPGVSDFQITDWRTAEGGNSGHQEHVIFYKKNDLRLGGAVSFDLPLNGMWSDLCADFVFFESDQANNSYVLSLEEIGSNSQWQREAAENE
jgi:hypothetical protein